MTNTPLVELARRFLNGQLDEHHFYQQCLAAASVTLNDATVDVDRVGRCGFPEAVFAEGKSIESLREICRTLRQRGQPLLATRVSPQQAQAIRAQWPEAHYHALARTLRIPGGPVAADQAVGHVSIVTAGTSDLPVALEAQETLHWMNVRSALFSDVGVAGPHRLPRHLESLRTADAIVVVAGMEGALPSVVAGHVACPVIAVPTSVGYGAHFAGVAPLLTMLNSCAANVAVVNIDAGFRGGYLAGLIAARSAHTQRPSTQAEALEQEH